MGHMVFKIHDSKQAVTKLINKKYTVKLFESLNGCCC